MIVIMLKTASKTFLWLFLFLIICAIINFINWKIKESNFLNNNFNGRKTNEQLKKDKISRVISSAATFINDKIKPATTLKPKIKETISKPKATSKQKPVVSSSSTTISTSLTNHSTTLEDVTITIKSSIKFHRNRIALLLRTWMKRVLNQIYIITDGVDSKLKEKLVENHLIVTNCGKTHGLVDLCCKTSKEFEVYKQTNQKWWCHIDDDAYINIEALLQLLSKFDPDSEQIYIGRRSINTTFTRNCSYGYKKNFSFFSGGEYCISRLLANHMSHYFKGDSFIKMCEKCHFRDDVGVAFTTSLLNATSVETFLFHHVYDFQTPLSQKNTNLKEQIAHIPGGRYRIDFSNYTRAFNEKVDPRGFLSLHCILYPDDEICPKI